ncbi:MAG: ureidoglycolate lyase [Pseudaminobacter sp.]
MNARHEIAIEPLTVETITGFGEALIFDGTMPTSGGEWWRCWEGCAQLSAGRQWVGFVQARAGVPMVSEMEREPGSEIIIPVKGEIVQMVAHGTCDATGTERPDGRTARAFALKPGTALVMPAGLWHAAAFGLDGEAAYFYVAERRRAEDSEGRGGWVKLAGDLTLYARGQGRAEVAAKEVAK